MRKKTLMIFMTILFIAGSLPTNAASTDSSDLVTELQGMEIVKQETPSAIIDDGYFSIWHNSDNRVYPNQLRIIDFHIDNWFETIKDVEIIVWAENYNTGDSWQITNFNETLYPYDTYFITYDFNVTFTFPYEGEYDIYVQIIDFNDGQDVTYGFWFEAWTGWLDIWVYQGYTGRINQELPVTLEISNTFEGQREITIDIIVYQYNENGTNTWHISSETFIVNSTFYSGIFIIIFTTRFIDD